MEQLSTSTKLWEKPASKTPTREFSIENAKGIIKYDETVSKAYEKRSKYFTLINGNKLYFIKKFEIEKKWGETVSPGSITTSRLNEHEFNTVELFAKPITIGIRLYNPV